MGVRKPDSIIVYHDILLIYQGIIIMLNKEILDGVIMMVLIIEIRIK